MAGNEYLGPVDADGNSLVRLAIEEYYSTRFIKAKILSNDICRLTHNWEEQILDIDEVYDFIGGLSPEQAFDYGICSGKIYDDEYYKLWKRADGVGFTAVGNPQKEVMDNISNHWRDIARGKYNNCIAVELRRNIERLMSQPGGTASNSIKRTGTSKARTPTRKAPARKATSGKPARASSRRY